MNIFNANMNVKAKVWRALMYVCVVAVGALTFSHQIMGSLDELRGPIGSVGADILLLN
jgi:hypothetical protein